MILFIVLCLLLSSGEALIVSDDSPKSERSEEVDTRLNRIKPSSIKYLSLPTEKCANITSDGDVSEEKACIEHCEDLKKGFFDGECIDGTCHCKLDVTAIVGSTGEKARDKGKATRGRGRHGVKCNSLIRVRGQIGSENHKGCGIHCRLLGSDNKDGRCVDGVCQCSREAIEEKRTVDEDDEEECRRDEECESDCVGRNREPRCMSGICRCRIVPPQQDPIEIPGIDREVRRCEHRRRAISNEICRSYCEEFSKDHREGRCVDGVCHCGYAVFEMMENATDEGEDNKSREMRGRSRGRL